jgi:hypothetical protein
MVLVNSGVHTQKNFSENYPLFGHAVLKVFASPVLGQNHFKNIHFSGHRTTLSARGAKLLPCAGRPVPVYAASLINFTNNLKSEVSVITYYWHVKVGTRQETNCLMYIPCISDVLEEKTNNIH